MSDADVLEEVRRKIDRMREAEEKCGNIRNVIVCVGDEVVVRIGRLWYSGIVTSVSKLGISMLNSSRETGIALGKISVIEIARRGDVYRKVYGTPDEK